MCSATGPGVAGCWQMHEMSSGAVAGPAARKSRARLTSRPSFGCTVTPGLLPSNADGTGAACFNSMDPREARDSSCTAGLPRHVPVPHPRT